jgi:outer membrane protein OmpA-like peptidoglycan-associated protein/tetratricopeptide (TPR) repeat protein
MYNKLPGYQIMITRAKIAILTLFISGNICAQSPAERRANRLFENFSYEPAIELYEYVIRKHPENKSVIRNLAESYRKTNNPVKSAQWLARVIEAGIARNEDYLYYAQALEMTGKKEDAAKYFEKYDQLMGADKRGERFAKSLANYADLFMESGQFRIENIRENSVDADFSPAFYPGGILLVSERGNSAYIKSVFPWNNRRWLDLFLCTGENDSNLTSTVRMPDRINSKYHEGPVSYSAERNLLAFTRNNYYDGKVHRSSDHINKLSILFSSQEGKKWTKPTRFPYNSKEYSTGHPAFGISGNTLWFVSDMPGGYGGTDVYVSRFENNSWTKPENLGPAVNSEGNELFPYVLNDSLMYFASNGWGGLGGLDIFKFNLKDPRQSKPENIGSPINSAGDDFGLIMRAGARSGFFSSNRAEGKGNDDIYRFTYSPKPSEILVIDQDEVKPVARAMVSWQIENGPPGAEFITDGEGKTETFLKPCQWYQFRVKAEGYPEKTIPIQTACPVKPGEEIRILIKKPKLYGNVFNKYLNVDIEGASVKLFDLSDGNKEVASALTDSKGYFRFILYPCHEYNVIAHKDGLPDVSRIFKAPCTDKEEDVAQKLGMGIAPQRGVSLQVFVTDEQTGSPIPGARIRMMDKKGEVSDYLADENGAFETILLEGNTYNVSSRRIGFFSTSKSKTEIFVTKGDRKIIKELKLLRLKEGGVIALEGIFYDLAKFEIRSDAAKVLDYVVQVMEENPLMKIELGSHTDSRGSDDDNMILSDKRAKAAAEYIISKGIQADRISGRGYGETQLKNKCGNGVKCPDKLHQENRRTEIRILDFE